MINCVHLLLQYITSVLCDVAIYLQKKQYNRIKILIFYKVRSRARRPDYRVGLGQSFPKSNKRKNVGGRSRSGVTDG